MKNKGFTLIELLAIIVILAIIAVITVPQIANVIEDSRKNSTKDSAYGYKNAVHQYYLTNSTENSELSMDGNFSIENGKITDGVNTFNISTTGSTPESGEVTIVDGEITDGCIDYGKYSVLIENGEVLEANEGACYDVSYFTYDENAEESDNGRITSKLSSPNSSWPYYVKEFESRNRYRYGVWDIENDDILSGASFLSLSNCQNVLSTYSDEEDIEAYECRVIEKYKTYQLCGVVEDKTFCLKPGENNREYNISILNNVFDDCSIEGSDYLCGEGYYGIKNNNVVIDMCVVGLRDDEYIDNYYGAECIGHEGSGHDR